MPLRPRPTAQRKAMTIESYYESRISGIPKVLSASPDTSPMTAAGLTAFCLPFAEQILELSI
jgi:hypothetical protein